MYYFLDSLNIFYPPILELIKGISSIYFSQYDKRDFSDKIDTILLCSWNNMGNNKQYKLLKFRKEAILDIHTFFMMGYIIY